jgi:hypothetical protein
MKIGRQSRCNGDATKLLSATWNRSELQLIGWWQPPMTHKDDAETTFDLHIDELIAVTDESAKAGPQDSERRRKPRLKEPFPARIWGIDSGDLPFNVDCVLDNISASGAYLRMPREMQIGSEVRMIVHLLNGPTTGATATLQGNVLRHEPQADGRHGIAVTIKRHKFL